VRILEHEPEAWQALALDPLPIRMAAAAAKNLRRQQIGTVLSLFSPAIVVGLIAASLPAASRSTRLLRFIIWGGLVLMLSLLLLPAAY